MVRLCVSSGNGSTPSARRSASCPNRCGRCCPIRPCSGHREMNKPRQIGISVGGPIVVDRLGNDRKSPTARCAVAPQSRSALRLREMRQRVHRTAKCIAATRNSLNVERFVCCAAKEKADATKCKRMQDFGARGVVWHCGGDESLGRIGLFSNVGRPGALKSCNGLASSSGRIGVRRSAQRAARFFIPKSETGETEKSKGVWRIRKRTIRMAMSWAGWIAGAQEPSTIRVERSQSFADESAEHSTGEQHAE